jgi:hypothetical protein
VRLVVALTEAGGTLRYSTELVQSIACWGLASSRLKLQPLLEITFERNRREPTYSSWRWWLGVWLDDDQGNSHESQAFLVDWPENASPNLRAATSVGGMIRWGHVTCAPHSPFPEDYT